jgi:hypothetical protein
MLLREQGELAIPNARGGGGEIQKWSLSRLNPKGSAATNLSKNFGFNFGSCSHRGKIVHIVLNDATNL